MLHFYRDRSGPPTTLQRLFRIMRQVLAAVGILVSVSCASGWARRCRSRSKSSIRRRIAAYLWSSSAPSTRSVSTPIRTDSPRSTSPVSWAKGLLPHQEPRLRISQGRLRLRGKAHRAGPGRHGEDRHQAGQHRRAALSRHGARDLPRYDPHRVELRRSRKGS